MLCNTVLTAGSEMFEFLNALGEALLRLAQGIGLVRCIFSPSYRARVRERYKGKPKVVIWADGLGAIVGLAFIIVIVAYVVWPK
jgi:hypothetical protein